MTILQKTPFKYHWVQLNSGKRGIKEVLCYSRQEFVMTLARWNALNPTAFKYWEVVDKSN